MNINKIAFVDIETTGISPVGDRIIEIGILVLENGKIQTKYSKLINPETTISHFITSITGIKNEDVEDALTFEQLAPEIFEILDGCVFVAHNVRFDYGFIKAELERFGYSYNSPHFCTVQLSRQLYPKYRRHGLDFIIKRHRIKCENRHRAFGDAEVICKFFQMQHKKFGAQKIQKVIDVICRRISWPAHVPKPEIESLPNTPGVYIFYGEDDAVLYVGKSINIKQRVLSHFTDDIVSIKEMKLTKQLRRIEAIQTAGELGALIKESELVKKLMPLYNQRLRKSEQLTVLKTEVDSLGYNQIKILNTHEEDIAPEDVPNIYGIFRTAGHAKRALYKISEEHKICRKLLGLEKTKRSCFGYQLKKCHGACIKEEPQALFNARFDIAFSSLRLKKWPYQKPIKILEGSEDSPKAYMLDKWCLFEMDEEGEPVQNQMRFDLDLYKILKGFLLNPKNQRFIVANG